MNIPFAVLQQQEDAEGWVEKYWTEDAHSCEGCPYFRRYAEKHGMPGPFCEVYIECLALVEGRAEECPEWKRTAEEEGE